MARDTGFDDIADAFEAEIYGTSKGYVRLSVLWEDMLSAMPEIEPGGLSVLDAGGGAGHVAVRLAALGNHVLLGDPSGHMLAKASERIERQGVGERVSTLLSTIDELPQHVSDRFDLVTCHAVLEWLGEPRAAVGALGELVKPGGKLSLMFYNRNAAVLKRFLRGEFSDEPPSGPPTPLDEADVSGWLTDAGLRVVSRAGIRIFHDHLPAETVRARVEELLEVEKRFRSVEPFASLGQHIHLVCERGERLEGRRAT
ncbi:MAG: methyltransferase [Dehalococcoidia bacterium]